MDWSVTCSQPRIVDAGRVVVLGGLDARLTSGLGVISHLEPMIVLTHPSGELLVVRQQIHLTGGTGIHPFLCPGIMLNRVFQKPLLFGLNWDFRFSFDLIHRHRIDITKIINVKVRSQRPIDCLVGRRHPARDQIF